MVGQSQMETIDRIPGIVLNRLMQIGQNLNYSAVFIERQPVSEIRLRDLGGPMRRRRLLPPYFDRFPIVSLLEVPQPDLIEMDPSLRRCRCDLPVFPLLFLLAFLLGHRCNSGKREPEDECEGLLYALRL